jgi:hypothetical protein
MRALDPRNWNPRLVVLVLAATLGLWWAFGARWDGPPPLVLADDAPSLTQVQERPDKLILAALRQVYAAFELNEPEAIYDALALATAPQVLEQLYLQKQATLQSGLDPASQTLHSIELRSLDYAWLPNSYNLVFDVRWAVIGLVGHGVHQHIRGNVYSARITMAPWQGQWRMVDFALKDVDRSDAGRPIGQAQEVQDAQEILEVQEVQEVLNAKDLQPAQPAAGEVKP